MCYLARRTINVRVHPWIQTNSMQSSRAALTTPFFLEDYYTLSSLAYRRIEMHDAYTMYVK